MPHFLRHKSRHKLRHKLVSKSVSKLVSKLMLTYNFFHDVGMPRINANEREINEVTSGKGIGYCWAFFRFYCDNSIWQQAVAKLDY